MNEVNEVRSYNEGTSNYSQGHKWQVWDIWIKFKVDNPFDSDLIKRVCRIKKSDGRLLDLKKIRHISLERIRQFQNDENVFTVSYEEPKDITLAEMVADYDLSMDDFEILNKILYTNADDRVSDYESIVEICDKMIKKLEDERNNNFFDK